MRERLERAIRAMSRTAIGKKLVHAAVLGDPAAARLDATAAWPVVLEGFEDLTFLFSSNQLNHGIASLQLDEGALLYRLARHATSGPFVEIGRFRGGSTMIFAAGLPAGAELWSYDLHVMPRPEISGTAHDRELGDALERYGLTSKVHLLVADSRTAAPPPDPIELLFIDGDHSYEGARADFTRWGALVRPGGHLLFHDAVDSGLYGNSYPGVQRLVAEVERDPAWRREPGAGSIAHFRRRD